MSDAETTTMSDRPLSAALAGAISAAKAAEVAYDACSCECCTSEYATEADRRACMRWATYQLADIEVEAARRALANSDEERDWVLLEEGHEYGAVRASSVWKALVGARDNVERANYPGAEGTIWVRVAVRCDATGESGSLTVQLDPDEPECVEGRAHDWQSPHELVGGIKENPGVWGHGGGVIIHEVCMACGCGRTTDTWAQNPETGEQGLESVSYEPEKHADEIRDMRLAKQRDEVIKTLNEYVHDAEECEQDANVFTVAWTDDEGRDIVKMLRARLPSGWECYWTGNSSTGADGTTTSDFRVEPE